MAVGPEDYGEWDDQTCDSRYQAICQKKQENAVLPDPPDTPSPLGTCPAGWMGHGSFCYQVRKCQIFSVGNNIFAWELKGQIKVQISFFLENSFHDTLILQVDLKR